MPSRAKGRSRSRPSSTEPRDAATRSRSSSVRNSNNSRAVRRSNRPSPACLGWLCRSGHVPGGIVMPAGPERAMPGPERATPPQARHPVPNVRHPRACPPPHACCGTAAPSPGSRAERATPGACPRLCSQAGPTSGQMSRQAPLDGPSPLSCEVHSHSHAQTRKRPPDMRSACMTMHRPRTGSGSRPV